MMGGCPRLCFSTWGFWFLPSRLPLTGRAFSESSKVRVIIPGTTAGRDPYRLLAYIPRRSFDELETIASPVSACPFGSFYHVCRRAIRRAARPSIHYDTVFRYQTLRCIQPLRPNHAGCDGVG